MEGVEPAEEGYERGVPVDGDLVGGIRLHDVHIRLVGVAGGVGHGHIFLVLLSGVWSTDEPTREWLLNDNITPAETVVEMMFRSMPENLRKIYFR